jgi:hypothetical protein
MATNTNYYRGRGIVYLSKRDANGNPTTWWDVGNAPKVQAALQVEIRKHKESRSGNDLEDKIQATTKGGEVTITLEEIIKDNIALLLNGKKVTIASGSFSSSSYDTFASGAIVGTLFKTKHPNPTSFVLKDSAGAPATLVLNTDYEIADAKHGIIKILSLGSYVQPFRAQYAYAQYDVITGYEASFDDEYYFYLGGKNIEANPDQAIGKHIFRIIFSPADVLALLDDEQTQFTLKGTILRDSTRATDANYGGFLRWDYVDANS